MRQRVAPSAREPVSVHVARGPERRLPLLQAPEPHGQQPALDQKAAALAAHDRPDIHATARGLPEDDEVRPRRLVAVVGGVERGRHHDVAQAVTVHVAQHRHEAADRAVDALALDAQSRHGAADLRELQVLAACAAEHHERQAGPEHEVVHATILVDAHHVVRNAVPVDVVTAGNGDPRRAERVHAGFEEQPGGLWVEHRRQVEAERRRRRRSGRASADGAAEGPRRAPPAPALPFAAAGPPEAAGTPPVVTPVVDAAEPPTPVLPSGPVALVLAWFTPGAPPTTSTLRVSSPHAASSAPIVTTPAPR